MKILVFAHHLEVGGTQVNAIELTAALRDIYGHRVALFATPGPMVSMVREKQIPFIPAPEAAIHPSGQRMQALRDLVRKERPDVIHVWDWWQCLDAYYSVHLAMRVPMVVSDMCMDLNRILPKSLLTTFGTPELVERARAAGRRHAELLLPPVDTRQNAPGLFEASALRARHGITDSDVLLVTVSRFDHSLKAESLRRSLNAIRTLAKTLPVRLLLVGDGVLRPEIADTARLINDELRRPVVLLTGALLDPRPAYSAADIVIGMGSSILRAMAFAKPVVIVGRAGFAEAFTPETAPVFYRQGFYGSGDGDPTNDRLTSAVRRLLEQREALTRLGAVGRRFVVDHFSLDVASAKIAAYCQAAADERVALAPAVKDGIRTAAVWIRERRFWPASKAFVGAPADAAAISKHTPQSAIGWTGPAPVSPGNGSVGLSRDP